MSKKIKCKECSCSMHWSLPKKVSNDNLEYAKHCLDMGKTTILCGQTMKTKSINHEQYCKKFIQKSETYLKMDCIYEKELEKLENMVLDNEEN